MLYLVGTDLCHHDREVDIVACLEIILTKGNIKGVLERCVWPQTVRIESLVHNMIAWIISVLCWDAERGTSSSEADVGGVVGAFLAFIRVQRDFWAECDMKEPTPTLITSWWLPVPISPTTNTPSPPSAPPCRNKTPCCWFAEAPSLSFPSLPFLFFPFFNCIILVSFGLPLILWGR